MSFIPYQIDYKVTGAGKTLGISKKRVVFKFGFANRDALSERLTGASCRGSEHEVVLVLSIASGKRHVLLDGREVHFSQGEKMMNRGFDFPFSIRVPSVGSVHARLCTDSQPGTNPYNFFINGMSYFKFSKIYELGTPAMRVGQMTEQRSYHASNFTSNSELEAPPEERRLIAQAKLESMRELRERQEREASAPKTMNHEEGNLINFDDDVVGEGPPPTVPQQGGMYHASSLTMDPALQQSQSFPTQQNPPPPSGPAYQNYSLNTSAPPPPQQQYGYGAPAAPTALATSQYSQQNMSMVTQYSQPAPNSYAAPSPYAQDPMQQGSFSSQPPQQSYGYQPQQSFPTQSAPAPTYEDTQMAFGSPVAQQQQQQQPDFASPQSYGSAPAFAQPPPSGAPPPNQNYGYPPTNSGW